MARMVESIMVIIIIVVIKFIIFFWSLIKIW